MELQMIFKWFIIGIIAGYIGVLTTNDTMLQVIVALTLLCLIITINLLAEVLK